MLLIRTDEIVGSFIVPYYLRFIIPRMPAPGRVAGPMMVILASAGITYEALHMREYTLSTFASPLMWLLFDKCNDAD